MASNVKKAKKAVAQNPATTTGTVGVVVVALGQVLGWDSETTAAVATVALVLVPIARGLVPLATKVRDWWTTRSDA